MRLCVNFHGIQLEQFRKQKASQSPPPHSLMLLIQMDLMFHLQSLMKLRLTPSLHFLFDMCYLHPKKDGSKERSQRDDFEMKNTDIFISENTPPDRINGRVIMKKPQTRLPHKPRNGDGDGDGDFRRLTWCQGKTFWRWAWWALEDREHPVGGWGGECSIGRGTDETLGAGFG